MWGSNIEFDDNKKVIDIFDAKQQYFIEVFLLPNSTIEEIDSVKNELIKIKGIKKITYISKEEALEKMKDDLKVSNNVLNNLKNSLSASFQVFATTFEDAENIEKEIKSKKLKIEKISSNHTAVELYRNTNVILDMIIKDNTNNKFYFANTNIVTKKINNSREIYDDIYVVRNTNKELEGFIVTKENNKKVFLDQYKDTITEEYSFMNFVNIDNKPILVCSNSIIEDKNDLENADFVILDIKGSIINIGKNDFIEKIDLEQKNYTDENAIEYF